jgi:hypothetical protein
MAAHCTSFGFEMDFRTHNSQFTQGLSTSHCCATLSHLDSLLRGTLTRADRLRGFGQIYLFFAATCLFVGWWFGGYCVSPAESFCSLAPIECACCCCVTCRCQLVQLLQFGRSWIRSRTLVTFLLTPIFLREVDWIDRAAGVQWEQNLKSSSLSVGVITITASFRCTQDIEFHFGNDRKDGIWLRKSEKGRILFLRIREEPGDLFYWC